MIRFYIPAEHRDVDTTIIEFIFYDFSKWMRKNKLTSIDVTLKRKAYDPNKHFNNPIWKKLRENNTASEPKIKSGYDNE